MYDAAKKERTRRARAELCLDSREHAANMRSNIIACCRLGGVENSFYSFCPPPSPHPDEGWGMNQCFGCVIGVPTCKSVATVLTCSARVAESSQARICSERAPSTQGAIKTNLLRDFSSKAPFAQRGSRTRMKPVQMGLVLISCEHLKR